MSAKAKPRKPRFAAANRLPSTAQARLRLDRVSKTFGAVEALRAVDLEIRQGEVTALVGDNGAGKSTLMKIVAGAERADSGRMFLDGRELHIRSPHDAADAGIQTVFQDLALCENLDVTANLFLGREWTRGGVARLLPPPLRPLDSAAMEAQAIEAIRKLDVKTLSSPQIKVGLLSGGQRQAVAIARAVRAESTVVLLDEPTAALGVAQTAQVLASCANWPKTITPSCMSRTISAMFSRSPTASPFCATARSSARARRGRRLPTKSSPPSRAAK